MRKEGRKEAGRASKQRLEGEVKERNEEKEGWLHENEGKEGKLG